MKLRKYLVFAGVFLLVSCKSSGPTIAGQKATKEEFLSRVENIPEHHFVKATATYACRDYSDGIKEEGVETYVFEYGGWRCQGEDRHIYYFDIDYVYDRGEYDYVEYFYFLEPFGLKEQYKSKYHKGYYYHEWNEYGLVTSIQEDINYEGMRSTLKVSVVYE